MVSTLQQLFLLLLQFIYFFTIYFYIINTVSLRLVIIKTFSELKYI